MALAMNSCWLDRFRLVSMTRFCYLSRFIYCHFAFRSVYSPGKKGSIKHFFFFWPGISHRANPILCSRYGGWVAVFCQCVWNGAQYIRACRAGKPYSLRSGGQHSGIAVYSNIQHWKREKRMEWMEPWRIYRCTCSHRLTARFIRRYHSSRGAGISPLSPTPSVHTHNFFFFSLVLLSWFFCIYGMCFFFLLLLYVILSLVLHDRSGTWPGHAWGARVRAYRSR